jgi:hypothetical protein
VTPHSPAVQRKHTTFHASFEVFRHFALALH